MYVDPVFEARKKSVLSGQARPPSSDGSKVQGSFIDSSFEKRRQQIISTPSKPVQTNNIQAELPKSNQGLISTVKNTIKDFSLQDVAKSFIAGTKALPGMVTQAGGIIGGAWVKQQQAINSFFKNNSPAVNQALMSIDPKFRYLEPIQSVVEKLATKYVEPKALDVRNKGVEMSTKVRQEYEKNKKPSTGVQGIAEMVAYNLPQVLASTGISVALGLVTKNPALATSFGITSSFGLGASEVYNQARTDGVSDQQALPLSIAGGSIIGAIDFLPLNRLIRKTGAFETVKKSLIKNIASNVLSIGTQSGFEGITEAIQEIVGNAVARTYNEHQNLLEGVPEAAIVGSLIGGGSDITINSILGITGKGENSIKEIEAKVEDAILTPPEKRTSEQQSIADAALTQNLTPDDAMSFVIENDLGKTETGKEIVKLVVQAKQQDKNILVKSTQQGSLDVELVDPGVVGNKTTTAEAATAEQYIKNNVDLGDDQLWLDIKETSKEINLSQIELSNTGTGKGTEIINKLKDYADKTGKELKISSTVNEDFFQKFKFLVPNYGKEIGDTTFTYSPSKTVDTKTTQPPQQTGEGGKVDTQAKKNTYKNADDFIQKLDIEDAKKRAIKSTSVDEFIKSYEAELDNIEETVDKNAPQETISPEIQRIREKISKEDFENIIERFYPQVREFYREDGINSFKDYIEKVDPDTISIELDSHEQSSKAIRKALGGDQFAWDIDITDIINQYKENKLVDRISKEQFRVKTDKISDIPFTGKERFYQTSKKQDIKNISEIYKTATQKVNKDNKKVVETARKNLFIAWTQNNKLHEALGITSSELNKKIKSLTGQNVDAALTQQRLNESVPSQFAWTGITNSSYVYKADFTGQDVESVVNKIEDNTKDRSFYTTDGEQLRKDIMNAFLSIDTRLDYGELNFKINRLEKALGEYNNLDLTITIDRGFENTVAHEIGHYLDYKFARELGIDKSLSSGSINWDFVQKKYKLSDEHVAWAKEFNRFAESLGEKSDIGFTAERADYLQRPTEVFARFVSKFVGWTTKKSGNRSFEENYYTDRFSESDYVQFIKLLQKKAELDSKYKIKPLIGGFATTIAESKSDEIIKAKQKLSEMYNSFKKESEVVTTEYTNTGKIKSIKGRSENSIDGLRESMSKAESPQEALKALNSFVTEYIDGADKRQLADLRAALVKEVTNLTGGTGNYKKDYAMRVTLRNDEFIGDLVRGFEDNIAEMDRLIPITETKTEAIVPPQKAVSKVAGKSTTGTPGPVGSGMTKQSKAYTRVVDRLAEETRLLTTYNELNLKQDAENAIAFIESNPQEALRVALGIDSPPQGQTETAISIALADRAAQEGNFQLQSHLESSRSLRQTRRGQEIVSERGRFNDESPYRYVQEVLDRRLREIGKGVIPSTKEEVESIMSKGGSKKRAVDKVDRVARELKKRLTKEQTKINLAQDIINSLIC